MELHNQTPPARGIVAVIVRDVLTYFTLAVALAELGQTDEAHSALKAGLALNPSFTVSRARATYMPVSDNPTYLAQTELILEGFRKAGVPEE
jgi:hypothetical protein